MKLPTVVEKTFAQFDQMSIRERALIAGASLVATVMIWTIAVMDPMSAKTQALQSESASLQESLTGSGLTAEDEAASNVAARVQQRETKLLAKLADINAQLASKSAGLIAPERMVQVIHDVLSNQRGITFISLQNKPVSALVEPLPAANGSPAGELTGPYVHRVELVIEGRYLDIMQYLKALETLPWRFYWRSLELQTTHYPISRVRIELSTLSLDKDWIGV